MSLAKNVSSRRQALPRFKLDQLKQTTNARIKELISELEKRSLDRMATYRESHDKYERSTW